jgi:hypothetical protein
MLSPTRQPSSPPIPAGAATFGSEYAQFVAPGGQHAKDRAIVVGAPHTVEIAPPAIKAPKKPRSDVFWAPLTTGEEVS